MLTVTDINKENAHVWLEMACQLWPDYGIANLQEILFKNLKSENRKHWLCANPAGEFIGFIDLALRHDYVEGCNSTPVGYIEGLYVKPEYRKNGVAKFLVSEGEKWAKSKGCIEFASDTEMRNIDSQRFHEKVGFKDSEVIVHFWKHI